MSWRCFMTFYKIANMVLAWLPAIFLILLMVIYPLRLYIRHRQLTKTNLCFKVNRLLRKIHKELGVLTIGLTFLHCRISSQKLGLNTGSICLALIILISCTYFFRKYTKRKWLASHRCLTVILVITLVAHILITRFTTINV